MSADPTDTIETRPLRGIRLSPLHHREAACEEWFAKRLVEAKWHFALGYSSHSAEIGNTPNRSPNATPRLAVLST